MAKHTVEFEVKVSGKGEQGFKRIEKASDKAQKSSVKYQKSIALLRKELTRLTTQRDLATDPKRIKALNREIEKTKKQIDVASNSTGKLSSSFKKLGAIVAGAAIGKQMLDIGRSSVKASAQMEKFNVTLQTMLGSKSKANARMNEYLDIAKKTPFQLEQVVSAGNQLQAIGKYSRENLVMLGDLAAASGKPLEQVMGAYSKLATGQKGIAVDMFRDLLISSQDWVDATGKQMNKAGSMTASAEEMMAALPKIMQKKGFTGLMAAQARTTEGMLSNLEDSMYSLKSALGEKLQPSVKSVVGWLSRMTGSMENVVKIPMEEKVAREKVELNMLVGQLIEANDKEEERQHWISEIQTKYPEFLKNIDLEKEGTEGLKKALVDVNAEYDKRIKKAVYASKLEQLMEDYEDEMGNVYKYQMAQEAEKALPSLKSQIKALGTTYESLKGYGGEYYNNAKRVKTEATPEMRSLYGQILAYEDALTTFGGASKKEKKSLAKAQMIAGQIQLFKDKMGVDSVPEASEASTTEPTSGGDASGNMNASSGSGSGIGGGTGGGSSRAITNNIGTLVGTIEIHSTTLSEGADEVKRLVTQALLEAIPE